MSFDEYYRGREVLITGGLGFLGSNLARRLAGLGARVTLIDNFQPGHGANMRNIEGIESDVRVVRCDIRDADAMAREVAGREVIFHIAGQTSHTDSMKDPFPDIDINCRGNMVFLESVRRHNPGARVVYASTRAIYGAPVRVPADEETRPNPTDIYGADKFAGEQYHNIYHRAHGIPVVVLRCSNSYGPRAQIAHPKFGILNWFVGLILRGETIRVFGDGAQLRDYTYVDDTVEAFLAAGELPGAVGRTFNIGAPAFNLAEGAKKLGLVWPILFITVACGAISGFHALVAGGTSSKQLCNESHTMSIGYGGMLLEGLMAVAVLSVVAAGIEFSQYRDIVFPAAKGVPGNPILAFALGIGSVVNKSLGIPQVYGTVFGILLVEGFVVTTLDTAVRLNRYLFEEMWDIVFKGKTPKLLKSYLVNAGIVVVVCWLLARGNTITKIWPIFGAANQLLAALVLIVVAVWLSQRKKPTWFVTVPAAFTSTRPVSDDDQLIAGFGTSAPVVSYALAVTCAVPFGSSLIESGSTTRLPTATWTTSGAEPDTPRTIAVVVALPAATAVTRPDVSTRATWLLLEANVAFAAITLPFASSGRAIARVVSPGASVATPSWTDTLAGGGSGFVEPSQLSDARAARAARAVRAGPRGTLPYEPSLRRGQARAATRRGTRRCPGT